VMVCGVGDEEGEIKCRVSERGLLRGEDALS
jgi:hypothetical protein